MNGEAPCPIYPAYWQAQALNRAGLELLWYRAGGDSADPGIGETEHLPLRKRQYSLKPISC